MANQSLEAVVALRGTGQLEQARKDFRNAILCAGVVTIAFLVVNPFVNMPFDDDWSYSYTVRQLLATGRITYHGWSAPLIITHALWGAVFCKIFGYSFVTLRMSTLPLVIGTAVFSYLLAREAKLGPGAAVCAALTLCLSPLFLPLADSFMTDVPALCYTVVSLYALARAGRSSSVGWLILGVIVGILGGMARQTVWLAPLCIVPYLVVVRRADRGFVIVAVLGWVAVVVDIAVCLAWFVRQPDIYLDPSLAECIRKGLEKPGIGITNVIMVVFTTVMFALPLVLPFTVEALRRFWRERKSWRGALTALVVLGLSLGIAAHPAFGMGPWLFNIVTAKGVIGPLELSGSRPTALPLVVRGIVSGLVLVTSYLLAARVVEMVIDFRASAARVRRFLVAADARAVLVIFSVVYLAFMVIRAGQDQVFDRYCLPLVFCLGVLLVRDRGLGMVWPMVVIFAVYAVASTQDNLALAAARRAAVDRLIAAGVPRTEIAAGFEYDFYTQLEEQGRINRYGMTNPTGPFNDLEGYTPAMICRYRLEFPRGADMRETGFGSVDYVSWLPPFHRRVYIDEFRNPWWLDAGKRAGATIPLNFENDHDN
jgi:hypothetical protein